jgi:HNH endonuclease/Helix-turn-helix domain
MAYIDIKQACALYKFSNRTIYRWIKEDKIGVYLYQGRHVYKIDDLQNAYDKRHSFMSVPKYAWVKKDGVTKKSTDVKDIMARYKEWLAQEGNLEKATDLYENLDMRQARLRKVPRERWTTQMVLEEYGSICYLCYEEIDLDAPRSVNQPGWRDGLHIDHVIPIAKGGHDTLDNLRPTHARCNLNKQAKLI